MSALDPFENLHHVLYYSPVEVNGGFEAPGVSMEYAWPDSSVNPHARGVGMPHYFFVTFHAPWRISPAKGRSIMRRNYDYEAREFADIVSVRMGKRVDLLGFTQTAGHLCAPTLASNAQAAPLVPAHPFVSETPRCDMPPSATDAIDLSAMRELVWIWTDPTYKFNPRLLRIRAACGFYARGMRTLDLHPAESYLNLVTAAEILAGDEDLLTEDHLDPIAKRIVECVRQHGDSKLLSRAIERTGGAKSRFVAALRAPLDDEFFDRSDAVGDQPRLRADLIEDGLRATYDVRSELTHAGKRLDQWVGPDELGERFDSTPAMFGDPPWEEKLGRCLTHLGLERVLRFKLLTGDRASPKRRPCGVVLHSGSRCLRGRPPSGATSPSSAPPAGPRSGAG